MAADSAARSSDPYWTVFLVRAIIALVPTVAITFTPELHNAEFGLIVFGAYAIVTAVVVAALSIRVLGSGRPGGERSGAGSTRSLTIVQSIIGVIAGVLALALATSGLGLLLYLVSVWAVLTGFLEIVIAVRARRRGEGPWRDWITVGGLTVIMAIVFVCIPADAKLAIGIFGVYTVVLCVFLAISAFSLKWGTGYTARATASVRTRS